jgi:hypothetical protein
MVLSNQTALVYILAESGCRGQLTSGRIERDASGAVNVFDGRGDRFEYLSGQRLRSWCVLAPDGMPLHGWREILPEDLPKILTNSPPLPLPLE